MRKRHGALGHQVVRRAVVALPPVAEAPWLRAKAHHELQLVPLRRFEQVDEPERLGRERGLHPCGRLVREALRGLHRRSVDNAINAAVEPPHPVRHVTNLVRPGHVTDLVLDGQAEREDLGEVLEELPSTHPLVEPLRELYRREPGLDPLLPAHLLDAVGIEGFVAQAQVLLATTRRRGPSGEDDPGSQAGHRFRDLEDGSTAAAGEQQHPRRVNGAADFVLFGEARPPHPHAEATTAKVAHLHAVAAVLQLLERALHRAAGVQAGVKIHDLRDQRGELLFEPLEEAAQGAPEDVAAVPEEAEVPAHGGEREVTGRAVRGGLEDRIESLGRPQPTGAGLLCAAPEPGGARGEEIPRRLELHRVDDPVEPSPRRSELGLNPTLQLGGIGDASQMEHPAGRAALAECTRERLLHLGPLDEEEQPLLREAEPRHPGKRQGHEVHRPATREEASWRLGRGAGGRTGLDPRAGPAGGRCHALRAAHGSSSRRARRR